MNRHHIIEELTSVEFLAFDLETTGLWPISCRVVELGAVRFRLDGKEIARYEQLVDPDCEIPESVVRVHGITNRMVNGMPTISEALPKFLEFLDPASTILMAHNASFDLGFLSAAAAMTGRTLPEHGIIDTLDLARGCLPGLPNHRLETLRQHLGIAESTAHRSLADSLLLVDVFIELVERRRGLETLEDLFELSPPLAFDDGNLFLIEPPKGFEVLGEAVSLKLAITMVYEGGTKGAARRKVTPRGLLRYKGQAYLAAYCHIDQIEKQFRLDRIREFRVETR